MLEYLEKHMPCKCNKKSYYNSYGYHDHKCNLHKWSHIDPCAAAAGRGNLETLKWLHNHDFTWSHQTIQNAAGNGQLDCIKYCHEHGVRLTQNTAYNAIVDLRNHWNKKWFVKIKSKHFECFKYALDNGISRPQQHILKSAKELKDRGGDPRYYDYLIEKKII